MKKHPVLKVLLLLAIGFVGLEIAPEAAAALVALTKKPAGGAQQ